MLNGFSALEIINSALMSVIVLYLIRTEHRITSIETKLNIIMSAFKICPKRESDSVDLVGEAE